MDIDDRKLERAIQILELSDRDTISPADMLEVLHFILTIVLKVKEDAEAADATAAEASKSEAAKIDRKVKESTGALTRDIVSLRAIIQKLELWRSTQDKRTTDEDIETALEMGRDNEQEIRSLFARFRALSKKPGPPGRAGKMPRHRWEESVLYFENPDGTWDEGMDLRGIPGEIIHTGGGDWGAGMTDLRPGSPNVRIENGKIYVSTQGGGSTMSIEVPPETPDDSNVDFTFSAEPFEIVMNGMSYRPNGPGWTWDGVATATMFSPVGTGGDIYARIQS